MRVLPLRTAAPPLRGGPSTAHSVAATHEGPDLQPEPSQGAPGGTSRLTPTSFGVMQNPSEPRVTPGCPMDQMEQVSHWLCKSSAQPASRPSLSQDQQRWARRSGRRGAESDRRYSDKHPQTLESQPRLQRAVQPGSASPSESTFEGRCFPLITFRRCAFASRPMYSTLRTGARKASHSSANNLSKFSLMR